MKRPKLLNKLVHSLAFDSDYRRIYTPIRYNQIFLICLMALSLLTSCKKLVTVEAPVTSTTSESVFTDDITATAVLTRLYGALSQTAYNASAGLPNFSKRGGLSSDELSLWSGANTNDAAYYKNSLAAPVSGGVPAGHEIWSTCYPYILTCNQAIEELDKAKTLSPSIKQQLIGEAKFMRAFYYFYLVNLYGDIPLVLSTDYQANRLLVRTPEIQVYQQIISDLKEAQSLLSSIYLNGQLTTYQGLPERLRPSTWAASALLARVYLYTGKYSLAESEASVLISNSSLFSLSGLSNAFIKAGSGNNEAIWQLQPVNKSGSSFWNTEDARLFVLSAAPTGLNSTHIVSLSPSLKSSFESGDGRSVTWVGSFTNSSGTYYFPNKYKIATATTLAPTEYLMVFRLAEQYLIRAEARAQQNNISGAQSDLNAIRTRAGLPNTTASNQTSLLSAILHERQVELFTEWGHRWLDLKRTGNIDAVMTVACSQKGGVWSNFKQWYPIPMSDILTDPNLLQNKGY